MVENPLKDIEDKMKEFANSAADLNSYTPEKLIDIADKEENGDGSGRDDFDNIIQDAIDNPSNIPE